MIYTVVGLDWHEWNSPPLLSDEGLILPT